MRPKNLVCIIGSLKTCPNIQIIICNTQYHFKDYPRNSGINIIKSKTKVTEDQLNEVIQKKKDWFITSEEALTLGILTELL